ncbi:SpoIIE family protein phosphatase [Verticiella sediminum]|nr:SpoIIE family protein phosphatase [Verticiella sediminum]
MTTSLRTRVFLLVAAILALLAAFVMLVSQRAVTDTVYQAEVRAARNVLELLATDVRARNRQLLREKIATVRTYRAGLEQYDELIDTTLARFVALARAGTLDDASARRSALDWVEGLPRGQGVQVMVYDRSLELLSHADPRLHGASVQGLRDFKGEPFAAHPFRLGSPEHYAVYEWPPDDAQGQLHFGLFSYFAPWDWVVAVSMPAGTVEETVRRQREELTDTVAATAQSLALARSGFIFVFDGAGRIVVAPPAHGTALLAASNAQGEQVRSLLAADAERAAAGFTFAPADAPDAIWEVGGARINALDWYIAAAVPRSDLLQPAQRLLHTQGTIFLAMLGVALLLAWVFATRLIRPLNLLTAYARELPEQELLQHRPTPPEIEALPERHRDEVGRLAHTFLSMERQLRTNVRSLMQETTLRERIQSELSIARDIQLGLLPVALEPDTTRRVDLYASMVAAKEVGGDLYDYFLLADGRLCFVIGDVSGKGVPAALFMAITRTVVRAAAVQESTPGKLMEAINERLSENNPNLMFVTLFVGVLDLESGELAYANAGHPAPWLRENGAVRELAGRSGPACGIAPGMAYRQFQAVLAPGATLLGYTDGITEAENRDGVFYGEQRALDALAGLPPGADSASLAHALQQDVEHFAGGMEQADDITMIVVRRRPIDEIPV